MSLIRDWNPFVNVAVGPTLAECDPVNVGEFSKYGIHFKTGCGLTQYEIWGSDSEDGEYGQLQDEEDPPNPIKRIGLSDTKIFPVPESSFILGFIKIITNAAGTVTVYVKG
jgi:hypothetical protein